MDSGDILIQGQKQVEGMTEDQLRDSIKKSVFFIGCKSVTDSMHVNLNLVLI